MDGQGVGIDVEEAILEVGFGVITGQSPYITRRMRIKTLMGSWSIILFTVEDRINIYKVSFHRSRMWKD